MRFKIVRSEWNNGSYQKANNLWVSSQTSIWDDFGELHQNLSTTISSAHSRFIDGYCVDWIRISWNFHGTLHEGGFWWKKTAWHKDLVHGKESEILFMLFQIIRQKILKLMNSFKIFKIVTTEALFSTEHLFERRTGGSVGWASGCHAWGLEFDDSAGVSHRVLK
mgnify:CR=1 FL=1